MVVIELPFDERDPLYKCCCGIVHVKTGARVLAITNIFHASCMVFQLFFIPYTTMFDVIECIAAASMIISSSIMLVATFTFRPKLVIAYLATQLTLLICAAVSFTVSMLAMVFPESIGRTIIEQLVDMSYFGDWDGDDEIEIILMCFCFACVLFVSFMLEVFLLRVSFQCYNYLLDVRDARKGVSHLPPLRMESDKRGVFFVGLEHVN
ncbi:hypothetical protein PENTCL1PPCAC_19665, partial [Pristionchus entomophagus]